MIDFAEATEEVVKDSALPVLTKDDHILLTNNVRCWLVKPSDIAILTIEGNYVTVTLFDGSKITFRHSFAKIQRRLDRTFFQAHRGCIVNLAAVRQVRYHDPKRFIFAMPDGSEIILSRLQTIQFRKYAAF